MDTTEYVISYSPGGDQVVRRYPGTITTRASEGTSMTSSDLQVTLTILVVLYFLLEKGQ